jgi:hypothetical protein
VHCPRSIICVCAHLLLLAGLVLHHLLHDLLLLDQERPHNTSAHTVSATGSTISTGHATLTLLETAQSRRAHGGHAGKPDATITTPGTVNLLGLCVHGDHATGGLHPIVGQCNKEIKR